MVQTTVRPVLTVLRTVHMTMAAARASRPLVGSSCAHSSQRAHRQQAHGLPEHCNKQLRLQRLLKAKVSACWRTGSTQLRTENQLHCTHPHTLAGMRGVHSCHDGVWLRLPTMKMMEGLATSSTPMVRRLRCSTLSPETPGTPTSALASGASSISSSTCIPAGV